jgi:Domain of unknown function (DUF2703)
MSAAVAAPSVSSTAKKQIDVEFLYLDLDVCTRCRGTDANLDAALAAVGGVLDATGVETIVRKTLVASAAQAAMLGLVSSPTIRVNGKDIALEFRESSCDSCAEACGCGGTIDCRVWVWQGEEHTAAPVRMIVDAILREVYGGRARPAVAPAPLAAVPDNLARYFAAKSPAPAAGAVSCCAPAERESCCEPAAKASCCGNASSGSCGCR